VAGQRLVKGRKMLRARLDVPLHLYLNANDPTRLNPSLNFEHGTSKVQMRLKGGAPLHLDDANYPEPDFRTVSLCQIEIRDESEDSAWVALATERQKARSNRELFATATFPQFVATTYHKYEK
jgi:hypothetical protein